MDFTSIARQLIIAAIPILIAITFHEVAHGFVANRLGDPTAKMMGRLTLNPIAHIDPIGTIIVPIMLFIFSNGAFIFGTAKPVPVNFHNLKNPRRDSAFVSAAGPATNVIIAIISILLYILIHKISPAPSPTFFSQKIMIPLLIMLQYSISFNIFIAAFNLLPVPPLDGGRIVTSLLPTKHSYQFSKLEPYGILIVLALWFTGIAHYIIIPIQAFIKLIISIFLIPFGGLM
ncbi:MAG TPA: site-2 protease family protein [Thermodesulfovibrionales bacterium]|nr:site-2 protease family protein [Thermodesulfovibrionales bacterium]